jgi:hypothetical protein
MKLRIKNNNHKKTGIIPIIVTCVLSAILSSNVFAPPDKLFPNKITKVISTIVNAREDKIIDLTDIPLNDEDAYKIAGAIVSRNLPSIHIIINIGSDNNLTPAGINALIRTMNGQFTAFYSGTLIEYLEKESLGKPSAADAVATSGSSYSSDLKFKEKAAMPSNLIPATDVNEVPGYTTNVMIADGNCFYRAVADQLIHINHPFFSGASLRIELHQALRLLVEQGNFHDGRWASFWEIHNLARILNVVIGIVTIGPGGRQNFVYYTGEYGPHDTVNDLAELGDGDRRPVLRLAYVNGNHFNSLISRQDQPAKKTSEGGGGALGAGAGSTATKTSAHKDGAEDGRGRMTTPGDPQAVARDAAGGGLSNENIGPFTAARGDHPCVGTDLYSSRPSSSSSSNPSLVKKEESPIKQKSGGKYSDLPASDQEEDRPEPFIRDTKRSPTLKLVSFSKGGGRKPSIRNVVKKRLNRKTFFYST